MTIRLEFLHLIFLSPWESTLISCLKKMKRPSQTPIPPPHQMAQHPHRSRTPRRPLRPLRPIDPRLLHPLHPPHRQKLRLPQPHPAQNRPGQLHHRRALPDPTSTTRLRQIAILAPHAQGNGRQRRRRQMGRRDPRQGNQIDRGRAFRGVVRGAEWSAGATGGVDQGRAEACRGVFWHGGWECTGPECGGGLRRWGKAEAQ